ncbi:MAG: hypothetical protein LBN29_07055 [Mediterranea sp.]|jgi:hypothetical protein|nr:hypothetical protein [Mediterranea sp.]
MRTIKAATASLLLLAACLVLAYACRDENDEPLPDPIPDSAYRLRLVGLRNMSNPLTLELRDLPETLTFDQLRMELTGANWSVVETVAVPLTDRELSLTLPTDIDPAWLQQVDRGADQRDYAGYWPATSSDPAARVLTIGDLYLYQADRKVARLRLSNWSGTGTANGKATLYLQYADRPFTLTGSNNSYYYQDCSFQQGWNAFAYINPAQQSGTGGDVLCTTLIPVDVACYVTESR